MMQLLQPIKTAFLLFGLFLIYFGINNSNAQTIYPVYYYVITLQKDSLKIDNAGYYVKSVLDGRPDKTNIGMIKDGLFDSKYPAKLDTTLDLSLKKYFNELLPYKQGKTPIIIKITRFDISEMADANSDNGKTEISMEFYAENNNSYTKLFETSQSTSYTYSDVTKLHEKYIRKTLNKCIQDFIGAKINMNNPEVISYEQLIYTPPIDTTISVKEIFIPKAYYSKASLTVNGGFGYLFGKIPQEMPKELKNYIKGMRFAYNYGFDFSFYFTEKIGLGFNMAKYSSNNSIDYFKIYDENNKLIDEGKIINNISMLRYGPSLNYRTLLKNSNTFLKGSLSYNRVQYTDDAILFSKSNEIEAFANVMTYNLGVDYFVFKNIALNASLSGLVGSIKKMEVSGVSTELEEKSSLLRTDVNVGITLCY